MLASPLCHLDTLQGTTLSHDTLAEQRRWTGSGSAMCALGREEALGVKDLPCCSIGSTQLPDLASMGEGRLSQCGVVSLAWVQAKDRRWHLCPAGLALEDGGEWAP